MSRYANEVAVVLYMPVGEVIRGALASWVIYPFNECLVGAFDGDANTSRAQTRTRTRIHDFTAIDSETELMCAGTN